MPTDGCGSWLTRCLVLGAEMSRQSESSAQLAGDPALGAAGSPEELES